MTTGAGFSVPIITWIYQGQVAASGSMYVYQTGTTTLVSIYSDAKLTTPLSNPLNLDSNGQAVFYVDGLVNLRFDGYTGLAGAGTLIKSIDPVYPVGSAANLSAGYFTTEASLASATTTDLGSITTTNIIDITGTTTITSFGVSANTNNPLYFIRFSGALTLTYNATSLIIPNAQNYTTAAGDAMLAKYEGSGNWRITAIWPASSYVKSVKAQTFSNSGTYTPSAGLLYCIAEAIGGGGGGGGAKNGGSGTARGGAGGAGSYARKVLSAATVGASQTVTIGAAGTAGSNTGGNGGDGGDTSLGTLCIGKGGSHGIGVTSGTFGAAGAGGIAGTGDVTIAGQAGQPGFFGGQGGNSPIGWGYAGQLPSSEASAGSPGTGYGAGGSSGHDNVNTGFAGAAGTAGYVIITEYCSQ